MKRQAIAFLCLLCWSAAGCKRSEAEKPPVQGQPARAEPESALELHKPPKKVFSVPVGPRLGIFPGRGIGPIRFGASLATVERLMDSPCSEKSASLCRYAAHAVDFHFTDGKLSTIHIHGDERSFRAPTADSPDNTYGVFNGRFPQGAALGMYSSYVVSMLGEPARKEPISGEEPTVERHHYPDMVLEYDKLANGNVVLAGIVLSPTTPRAAADRPAHGTPGKNPLQAAAVDEAPSADSPAR